MVSAPAEWAKAMQLGVNQLQARELGAAAAAFTAAATAYPERPEAWVNLALTRLQQTDPTSAEQALNNALNKHPEYSPALSCMGDIRRSQGELEEASSWYRRALKLHPDPVALNNLATLTRTLGNSEEAEKLYLHAEKLAPRFTLPRVNRAIMQIELGRPEEAYRQLSALDSVQLSEQERDHQQSALLSVSEQKRLEQPIRFLIETADSSAFEKILRETDAKHLEIDHHALEPIIQWAQMIREKSGEFEPLQLSPLPHDWHAIEAAHMIPVVDCAEEYRALRGAHPEWKGTTLERAQTERMIPAIDLAESIHAPFSDPVRAEAYIRSIHARCTSGVDLEGLFPGHFKYTQSSSRNHPTARHVIPAKASGTFRFFVEELLARFQDPIARAALTWLALGSLHPFSDGNGRTSLVILNRNLIKSGLMPCLFTKDSGIKGKLGQAEEQAIQRNDVLPIMDAIISGQRYALTFLEALQACDGSP